MCSINVYYISLDLCPVDSVRLSYSDFSLCGFELGAVV